MDVRYQLSPQEVDAIQSLVRTATKQFQSAEDGDFLFKAPLYSHELPRSIRAFLNDFRMGEWKKGYCLISGYPVDEAKIGPTPPHWQEKPGAPDAAETEALLIMLGALLGDAFSWSTQQAGRVVHQVMPIKAHEDEQLGTGSKELLWWHNEDAFHPYRGDYLGMMCLRNPDCVATTLACIDNVELDDEQKLLLFEPHFMIHPDESHLEKNRGTCVADAVQDDEINRSYEKIDEMNVEPDRIAVLFGNLDSPYLRLDPYFMPRVEHPRAQQALERLIQSLDAAIEEVVLQPGDYCFIDNFKAVHGRKPFRARYDGADRWLTRINITRDLRKSRAVRRSCTSRVIE